MKYWLRSALTLFSLALPLAAHADCPPESSISRYVQSTGEALELLEGAVPESQYAELNDRYSAMVILKWDRLGLDSLVEQSNELDRIATCLRTPSCGAEKEDPIDAQITSILQQTDIDHFGLSVMLTNTPSEAMLEWAEVTLSCREPAPSPAPVEQAPIEPDRSTPAETEPATEPETPSPAAETRVAVAAEPAANAPTPQPSAQSTSLFATAVTYIESGQSDKAISPLKQACDADVAAGSQSDACETLLDVYKSNGGLSGDSQRYLAFADELCTKGYANGCLTLARHYRYAGQSDGLDKFATYTARSCELGDAEACAIQSNAYLANAAASDADLRQARTLRQKSCDLGRNASCLEVADMYLSGVGGAPDQAQAIKAASTACPSTYRGDADVCVSAADFVLIHMAPSQERADKIRAFTERACNNDHAFGCSLYATDLERGLRGAADPERASLTRLKACELGDKESCRTRS